MSVLIRWVIVVVAALVVIGLIAFARGPDHQRGDDVGAAGLVASAPVSSTG
ncbi:MAG TPA: hypothetical protein VFH10_11790 [Nocardioides sp.]|uniref:hypothetical protein n=1 Tax=Nocardioides sp. TaxID=35761 RepID=UPI002D811697|nr:hypothetical protein [Nocardioides sp.]HET6653316.1 hypothetical protein [Nocardioides sp.]